MKKLRIGLLMLFVLVIFAVLVSGDSARDARFLPPSASHPLGTDALGHDIISRIGSGMLVSFAVACPATLISALGGLLLSFGFAGRKFPSTSVIAAADSMRSLPPIILALFFNALSGPGIMKIVIALSIGNIPFIARMCHSRIAVLRTEGPAVAAECLGVGRIRIFISHIIPHLLPYLLLQCVSIFSSSILTEASLSYLGCGVPPHLPSLGSMLADARSTVLVHPGPAVYPAVFLLLIGISMELIARGIEEKLG